MTIKDTRTHIECVRDTLYGSPLIWFSRGNSGDNIKPVTAAFLDVEEALGYAKRNPGDFVQFPNGTQLGARFAIMDGDERFRERATMERAFRS